MANVLYFSYTYGDSHGNTYNVRKSFKRPLRPNAPTIRVLTSVILKGIGRAFRKLNRHSASGYIGSSKSNMIWLKIAQRFIRNILNKKLRKCVQGLITINLAKFFC